jgi:hypothetical protein
MRFQTTLLCIKLLSDIKKIWNSDYFKCPLRMRRLNWGGHLNRRATKYGSILLSRTAKLQAWSELYLQEIWKVPIIRDTVRKRSKTDGCHQILGLASIRGFDLANAIHLVQRKNWKFLQNGQHFNIGNNYPPENRTPKSTRNFPFYCAPAVPQSESFRITKMKALKIEVTISRCPCSSFA